MKRYLILLVILNITIFAYFKWLSSPSVNTHEALPDLQSEKVELLNPKDLQALPAESPPQPSIEKLK